MTSFYDWYGDLPVASPRVFGDQTDVPLVMGATYGEVTRSYTIGLVLGRRARVSSPVRGSADAAKRRPDNDR